MKIYFKTDVARQFFPHLRPNQALRQLKNKIRSKPPLEAELMAVGYRHKDRSHTFSQPEVEILRKYLGGFG